MNALFNSTYEIKKLQKENEDLKMENELLKKLPALLKQKDVSDTNFWKKTVTTIWCGGIIPDHSRFADLFNVLKFRLSPTLHRQGYVLGAHFAYTP